MDNTEKGHKKGGLGNTKTNPRLKSEGNEKTFRFIIVTEKPKTVSFVHRKRNDHVGGQIVQPTLEPKYAEARYSSIHFNYIMIRG
ncbi:MAG: hypothetical protein IKD90_09580 [Clostridiales bacterium]|nr:hypothetical protein [Clostridiales bacterium]